MGKKTNELFFFIALTIMNKASGWMMTIPDALTATRALGRQYNSPFLIFCDQFDDYYFYTITRILVYLMLRSGDTDGDGWNMIHKDR